MSSAKFQREGETGYIDEAIVLGCETVGPSHPKRSAVLAQLANHLWQRYKQLGGIGELNEVVLLGREALALRPPGDAERLESLKNLALYLSTRYNQLGEISDLNEAIVLSQDTLPLCPPGHPERATCINNLALHLFARYKLSGRIGDLGDAIVLSRDALSLCLPGQPIRWSFLNNLALYLSIRFDQLGEINDLGEAILLGRETLVLCPPGHSGRLTSLTNLSLHLTIRYSQLGDADDLNEAVVLGRDALGLYPHGHPSLATPSNNLAHTLFTRYKRLGQIDDLNEIINLERDVLVLHPPGHPDRPTSLSNLALYLSIRYDRLGQIDDLNQAIILSRDALSLRSQGHMDRSTSLNILATHLSTRYKQLGGTDDLDEAIVHSQDALALRPLGHHGRWTSLSNLALHLTLRYDQLGRTDDLNEAIVLTRDALVLCPPGHPDRLASLSNLALHLSTRYKLLGGSDDLDEAISLERDALALHPLGHLGRSTSLNNLALYLSARYKHIGGVDDLDEAIVLARDGLALHQPGHPDRAPFLHNLASHLATRYRRLSIIDDMNEAILLARDALVLCPLGHPRRSTSLSVLASHVATRHRQLGGVDDLNEAINLSRDALVLHPPGHPYRSSSLSNLADRIRIRFTLFGGIDVREEIFSLYAQLEDLADMASSSDLSAAKAWVKAAEYFRHPTTLLAYKTALRLLVQHLTALPSLPHHFHVFKSDMSSLAVDAFSACLRNQSPTNAVELLEQGRSVFWNQLGRLRSPLEDVIASGPAGKGLANDFTRLTSLIRMNLGLPSTDQHDRVCRLNLELQRVVSNIRGLPGLSRFLLPQSFSDLQRAASDGPVIILNASEHSCDALVVFADRDPTHIPLSIAKEGVQKLSSKLRSLTKLAKSIDMTREFGVFLRELWDKVVSYIVGFLQTIRPLQSRIWWCPTAEFSLLPLHAAGPFRKGQKNLSDLYTSSYTTTLSALIRARRPSSSRSVSEKKRFIAIGQGTPFGATELPSVGIELANIGQLVEGSAMFSRIEGRDSCISRVTDELGKNDWVHFSCHGCPNRKEPFESAFALHDGRFTIQHIIRSDLQNPEFAYLSACHTTVGDEEQPDETIHLASAMQFAGFRSVIGTMWAVDDAETAKITSVFYKHMLDESGHLDYTRAAYALRKTTKTVKPLMLDQRTLYVHFGA